MRVVLEAAEVKVQDGRILWVRSGQRRYAITHTLERFECGGRWWRGEFPRSYFVLMAQNGVMLEVYLEVLEWTLSAVQD